MPKYKVTIPAVAEKVYETDEKPEATTEGTTVEKISELPLEFKSEHLKKRVRVDRFTGPRHTSFLALEETLGAEGMVAELLNEDETRSIRDALTEALGEDVEEEAESFPLTIPTWFGEYHFEKGHDWDEGKHVRVQYWEGNQPKYGGAKNINREDAHRLGRALLSL